MWVSSYNTCDMQHAVMYYNTHGPCMGCIGNLRVARVKNNCWLLAVFNAKLPNGQAFLKLVGWLSNPKHIN